MDFGKSTSMFVAYFLEFFAVDDYGRSNISMSPKIFLTHVFNSVAETNPLREKHDYENTRNNLQVFSVMMNSSQERD